MRRLILVPLILLLLAACGQKGPLYLPGKARGDNATRAEGAASVPASDPRPAGRERSD